MSLHLRRWRRPEPEVVAGKPRLVLLHGFTQNAACWGAFAERLAEDALVDALDAPGHGKSSAEHDRVDLWQAAGLIHQRLRDDSNADFEETDYGTAGLEITEPGRATIAIGYSMGGRMALHLALQYPHSLAGLVLIGATPGIVDDKERAERQRADLALAARIRAQPLDRFLSEWLSNPLFSSLTPEAAALAARRQNRREGLAASLENCGTGSQVPLWDRLNEISIPTLLVSGAQDHKFRNLAGQMAPAFTNAEVVTSAIPGTHAVHLEDPTSTADVILDWLNSTFAAP